MIVKKLTPFLLIAGFIIGFSSCQKDYYKDSGIHDPNYNGTVLDYLKSRNDLFDTLVHVIHLAGMDDVFQSNTITFFAPADSSIKRSIRVLNRVLYTSGRDTVSKLSQISPDVWRSALSLYLFEGKHLLNDYPQLDLNAKPAFPGQYYTSYQGRSMNIGVIYNNAGGVQYAGYRQLVISYIPSLSSPQDGWITERVASVNIQPTNGVIHALRYSNHFFGFGVNDFVQNAIEQGIAQP